MFRTYAEMMQQQHTQPNIRTTALSAIHQIFLFEKKEGNLLTVKQTQIRKRFQLYLSEITDDTKVFLRNYYNDLIE